MLAGPVKTTPEFEAGEPHVLFEGRYVHSTMGWGRADYDVSPDGQRFLMVKEDERSARTRIHIVQNWFEELKRLVPTN